MTTETRPAIVGTRPIRPDGADKVVGRAVYGADVRLPGMLVGRVKRSPHAHAIIKRIDVSKALALPGVQAVVTHADFPAPREKIVDSFRGPGPAAWEIERLLARRKVLYRGHPVAAVCATDIHIAEDALDLIEVEYEVLPPVMSLADAQLPGAPILHDDGFANEIPGLFDLIDGRPTNIATRIELAAGDIEQGFRDADVVIEREYETATYHQGYIEPHNGTAMWSPDGRLTVWTSTQGAFGMREGISRVLGLSVAQLRVIPAEIGGGFGAKNVMYLEPLAALLSKKCGGRPVQLRMNYAEVLEATGPTSATRSWVRIGAKRDGTLVAADIRLEYEAGAYHGSPVAGGARCALGPYVIPNQRIIGLDIVSNKPKVAAYRAPGASAAEFAVESALDELALMLDVDPMTLRLKSPARQGDRRSDGATHGSVGTTEVIQAVIAHPHYRSEITGPNRGRGVAMGFWQNGGGESSAFANVHPDGRVTLLTGSVDIGGQRASLAMQFAESLGIPYEDVNSLVADTETIGFTNNTGGSRTTFATGWAVHQAALDIRRQLVQRIARIWEVAADTVTYDPTTAMLRGPGDLTMTYKEATARLSRSGGMIQGHADIVSTSAGAVGACMAAHIVDVEVDPDTGKVQILRYTAIQDVGKAIHPSYVEGQIQGGVAQGIGMALSEEYVYDASGTLRNGSLLDYRMPTALDLPNIDVVLVEVPNPGHPYGVRGVGEVPIVPPLAAVANAIFAATGIRVLKLPVSPRVMLEQLKPNL
ncbi:MAG: xanthine dehydrogenase family protein molybdopterin-binding subunit [Dehalococcoidia bacterium]|nr:xanthine dehydrogenase family protein molybdopterin-binding subunit [Dehalococcoidia bacterium]